MEELRSRLECTAVLVLSVLNSISTHDSQTAKGARTMTDRTIPRQGNRIEVVVAILDLVGGQMRSRLEVALPNYFSVITSRASSFTRLQTCCI